MQSASEAADLPGRAGLLSRRGYCHATPHHPGRWERTRFHLLFIYRRCEGRGL